MNIFKFLFRLSIKEKQIYLKLKSGDFSNEFKLYSAIMTIDKTLSPSQAREMGRKFSC